MKEKIEEIFRHFCFRARVFQSGALCHSASYDVESDVGYIHIVEKGNVEFISSSHKKIKVSEPSLVLYLQSTSHRVVPKSQQPILICASFKIAVGLSHPLLEALSRVIVIPLHNMDNFSYLAKILFDEAACFSGGRQAILDRLMEVMIIKVLRELIQRGDIATGILAGLADERLSRAILAIHRLPSKNWSVEELAAEATMSRARFAAHFDEVVGIGPGAYLAKWRLVTAKTLLLQGKSVDFIAGAVGYSSASSLSRVFKAQYGCTPTRWAKQQMIEES